MEYSSRIRQFIKQSCFDELTELDQLYALAYSLNSGYLSGSDVQQLCEIVAEKYFLQRATHASDDCTYRRSSYYYTIVNMIIDSYSDGRQSQTSSVHASSLLPAMFLILSHFVIAATHITSAHNHDIITHTRCLPTIISAISASKYVVTKSIDGFDTSFQQLETIVNFSRLSTFTDFAQCSIIPCVFQRLTFDPGGFKLFYISSALLPVMSCVYCCLCAVFIRAFIYA
jgi:hypothetical protein